MIDLVAQYQAIQPEIDKAIRDVLESGQFILGPNVAALEREVVAYLGVKHAVGVASGTEALVLALRALGIGPGDEVIVPTYTFFATAEAVMSVGASPVFVDIDPQTYTIDPNQVEDVVKKHDDLHRSSVNNGIRAIISVHLYGHPADMTPLLKLAQVRGLKVIEDNAQAFGAEYKGRKTGGLSDVGCLSFFPSKNLGAYGDGGMVVTKDGGVADRVRMLRTHGWRKKYYPEAIGHNSRLDELQAAILRVKLQYVDEWNQRRREVARQYTEQLSNLDVRVPFEARWAGHVYCLYVIRVKDRARLQQHLKEAGISSAVYYPLPLHLTDPCRLLGFKEGDYPVAEQASQETMALPLYPEMSSREIDRVAEAVRLAVCQQPVAM